MLTKRDYRDAEEALSPTLIVLEEMSETFARKPRSEVGQLVQHASEALSALILQLEADEGTAPEDDDEAAIVAVLRPGETVEGFAIEAVRVEVERRQRQGAAG